MILPDIRLAEDPAILKAGYLIMIFGRISGNLHFFPPQQHIFGENTSSHSKLNQITKMHARVIK